MFLLLTFSCIPFQLFLQGENLDLAIFKEEVVALIGEGVCTVKTLTHNHLYCEPPPQQPPLSLRHGRKQEGADAFPEFIVSLKPTPSQHTQTELDPIKPTVLDFVHTLLRLTLSYQHD